MWSINRDEDVATLFDDEVLGQRIFGQHLCTNLQPLAIEQIVYDRAQQGDAYSMYRYSSLCLLFRYLYIHGAESKPSLFAKGSWRL